MWQQDEHEAGSYEEATAERDSRRDWFRHVLDALSRYGAEIPGPGLTPEQMTRAKAMVVRKYIQDPGGGWDFIDEADLERNMAPMLAMLEAEAICGQCPGIEKCLKGQSAGPLATSPKGYIPRLMGVQPDARGRPSIRIAYARCRLLREKNRIDGEASKSKGRNKGGGFW